MRVNKAQGLLYIFDTLLEKGHLEKEDIINQIEISDLTFKRYMQELRAYIYNFNKHYEIVYSRSLQKYILKK